MSEYIDLRFNLSLYQYVVSLSNTLHFTCSGRLSWLMSTRHQNILMKGVCSELSALKWKCHLNVNAYFDSNIPWMLWVSPLLVLYIYAEFIHHYYPQKIELAFTFELLIAHWSLTFQHLIYDNVLACLYFGFIYVNLMFSWKSSWYPKHILMCFHCFTHQE